MVSSQYHDILLLVARIGLSLVFILSGVMKFLDVAGTAGFIASVGLPASAFLAIAAGIVELLAGLAVLAGWGARWGAWTLVAFILIVTVFFHIDFADPLQTTMLLKNLAIAGGMLYVAALGAGRFSIDERKRTVTPLPQPTV